MLKPLFLPYDTSPFGGKNALKAKNVIHGNVGNGSKNCPILNESRDGSFFY